MMMQNFGTSYLFGGNAPFVEELYENYLDNPASVPDEWREYFDKLVQQPGAAARDVPHFPVIAAFAEQGKRGPVRTVVAAGSDQKQVGESWELSGVKGNESVVAGGPEAGTTLPGLIARHGAALLGKANAARFGQEFPLLIKFIDARQDLSIQVHPNDALAWERHKSKGKTEMWYVVDADKGARLRSGFAKQVTPAQYEASVADHTITDLLAEYEIHPGDLFFLPAGRVHSIGAGAFIAEIQQTSDITYRIYDFNRKDANGNTRELHTELAKGAIDYTVLPDYRTHYQKAQDREVELVSCPYFTTSLYDLTEAQTIDYSALDSFVVVICVEGKGTLCDDSGNEMPIHQGETVLLPATVKSLRVIPGGNLKMLTSYIK